MKTYLFVFLAIIGFYTTKAQTEPMQTLFGNAGPVGWWVSTDFAYTGIDDRDAWLGGMSGGVIVNHNFSIGFAGYGILNSSNLKFSNVLDTADVYLYGGYGGLKLEYRFNPSRVVHLAFPLLIGGGAVSYSTFTMSENDWNHSGDMESQDYLYAWDNFFVIEPGVTIGVNVLKWMRFDIGASYRYAPGITLPKTDSGLMNGVNANFSLKFGKF